jgi:hypothetical protein
MTAKFTKLGNKICKGCGKKGNTSREQNVCPLKKGGRLKSKCVIDKVYNRERK